MNKKIIIGVVLLLVVIGVITYVVLENNKNRVSNNDNSQEITDNERDDNMESNKILVVYFSAQNHTKEVATKIANNLNADIFEIVPEDKYTSEDLDWNDNDSRVSREHNDESLRTVKLVTTTVDNWKSYDTILIGYPIWWGIAAWPVDTFVSSNDFSDKTVIPFCTSASSGIGESDKLLAEKANTGNWLDGRRFNSNATETDIKSFTDSLK